MDGQGAEPTVGMTILGIDAAWTTTEPSGVALVTFDGHQWVCRGLAPSYQQFSELAGGQPVDWTRRPPAGAVDIDALLSAARTLAGLNPDVIAVDMPLAFEPIVTRRISDTKISQLFGAAGAAVHSPSAVRPGPVAEMLRVGLERGGYELTVGRTHSPRQFALIETYPHPIAMWLCNSRRRLPYKAQKAGKYWPGVSPADRRRRLIVIWQDIIVAIRQRISAITLPVAVELECSSRGALKAIEDGIDALICATAGISYATCAAKPFGDQTSAIWLPIGCDDYAGRPDRYAHLADTATQDD
jgi:predicted RNase H-like nuclease